MLFNNIVHKFGLLMIINLSINQSGCNDEPIQHHGREHAEDDGKKLNILMPPTTRRTN
jgi:hypothetical protein